MGRRNISLPDSLDERLDRWRDRVNVSKVCAQALEQELDKLEGHATMTQVDESRVEQMVARLRKQGGDRQSWFRNGREDGASWAQGTASLQELSEFEEYWEDLEDVDLRDLDPEELEGRLDELPHGAVTHDARDQVILLQGAYLIGFYQGVTTLWQAARAHI